MTFLVVALNTLAKIAKLTTPSLKPSSAQPKILKIDFLLCLGVHLQITPRNYARKKFSRPGGARAPSEPPGYACVR